MPSARPARSSALTTPSSSEVLRDALSPPPALRASDHEDGTTYPDALPSALADRFNECPCVMGTAIISRHYCQRECPHLDQFVVPVVKKKKEGKDTACSDAASAPPTGQKTTPHTTGADETHAQASASVAHGQARRTVLQRGYIVFSDDYLTSHAGTLVAQCRQRHGPHCRCRCCTGACISLGPADEPSGTTAESECVVDGSEVERCIDAAENYHLPLFRRKPSKLVYGEGCYIACGYNTGLTEPPLCVRIPKRPEGVCGTPCCVDLKEAPQGGASVVLIKGLPDTVAQAFDSAEL